MTGTQIAEKPKPLPPLAPAGQDEQLSYQLKSRAEQFQACLPAHISIEKFQMTIISAVRKSPDLLKADRLSLINASLRAAQDGLLPDGREAAMVIFDTKVGNTWVKQVQYMPMVYGLRKKILQSGEITDIHTEVVYRQEIEAGLFIYEEGTERTLRHKPLLDPKFVPTDDDIACAYSIATYKDGSQSFMVMRRSEIDKVRQVSKTGAIGKTNKDGSLVKPKGPWVDWFSEMAKKTVMRRHAKELPMSGDIVDVEQEDHEIAAASLQNTLASDTPLPPRRAEALTHDPETGETPPPPAHMNDDLDDPGKQNTDPSSSTAPGAEAQDGAADSPPTNAASSDISEPDMVTAIIKKFNASSTIIDLQADWSELKDDIEALSPEQRSIVEVAYDTREDELKRRKA